MRCTLELAHPESEQEEAWAMVEKDMLEQEEFRWARRTILAYWEDRKVVPAPFNMIAVD